MKRITLFLVVCLFAAQGVFGQELELQNNSTPEELENYYMYKYKKKRKTAKAFLYSGLGSMALGALIAPSGDGYGVIVTGVAGGGLIALGAISSLISIPFYSKSKSFERKAEAVSPSVNVSLGTIRSPDRHDLALGLAYSF